MPRHQRRAIPILSFRCACVLALLLPACALAASPRYFEGSVLIEKTAGHEGCQRLAGKTMSVQISWQEAPGHDNHIFGWIVFSNGAPAKIEGPTPGQLTVTNNYYDAHLNTPTTLTLDIADGKTTGTLRETPTQLGFGETLCYWQQATLTLAEKTADTDVDMKLRQHGAMYKAHGQESRGDYFARYHQYAQAAAAHDQAIAEVDGVLPETYAYFKGLLRYTAILYSNAEDYERAVQRYQRYLDINVRQSDVGPDDPAFYSGWVRLATYLYLARRTDDAISAIERAASMEDKAEDVSLDEYLLRRRLQGNIYVAANMFDKAQASLQDEVNLATSKSGPDDLRTFEARARSASLFRIMKDNARFEAAFEPLAREITARFGEAHELARKSNAQLGTHYFGTDAIDKARPWLESAFRGYRAHADSAAQAVREDMDAAGVMASLLAIYIQQGIVPSNFLDRVRAGQTSLDALPYQSPQVDNPILPTLQIDPREFDKLLKR